MARLADVGLSPPASAGEARALVPWAVEFRYEDILDERLDRAAACEAVTDVRSGSMACLTEPKTRNDWLDPQLMIAGPRGLGYGRCADLRCAALSQFTIWWERRTDPGPRPAHGSGWLRLTLLLLDP
jgi:hypothetical protein